MQKKEIEQIKTLIISATQPEIKPINFGDWATT